MHLHPWGIDPPLATSVPQEEGLQRQVRQIMVQSVQVTRGDSSGPRSTARLAGKLINIFCGRFSKRSWTALSRLKMPGKKDGQTQANEDVQMQARSGKN